MNRYSSTKNVECVISEEDIVDPYADDQHEQRWSQCMHVKEKKAYYTLVRLRKQQTYANTTDSTCSKAEADMYIPGDVSDIGSDSDSDIQTCEDNKSVTHTFIHYNNNSTCSAHTQAYNNNAQTCDTDVDMITHDTCEWYKQDIQPKPNNIRDITHNRYTYGRCTQSIGSTTTATDIFHLVWPTNIYSMLAEQTNIFAKQKQQQNNSDTSKEDKYWHETDSDEIQTYIGLLIGMSLHTLPHPHHYWCSDPLLHVSTIASTMSRNRFDKIKQYIHINNNEYDDHKDPLYKIKPLLQILNESFANSFILGEHIAVDEALIHFKGTYACIYKYVWYMKLDNM